MKHGLFGGTFDPPHVGHLMMAEVARESLNLDVVDFIPTNIPPHKLGQNVQPASLRVKMLETALMKFPFFRVSTIELDRKGISYTIDTVRDIFRESPEDELFWLVGADMLKDLPHWKEVDELLSLVTVVAAPRPGIRIKETAERLHQQYGHARIIPLTMPELDISSTWLRERMKNGLRVDPLLPVGVAEVISQEGGYVSGPIS